MDNGLLHIDLAKPEPEVRVKTIPITRNDSATIVASEWSELGPVVESTAGAVKNGLNAGSHPDATS